MVNEKKPQHWGTQISCKNGKRYWIQLITLRGWNSDGKNFS